MKREPFLLKRPRRNRKSPSIRSLVQETHLHASDLIAPFFITEGKQIRSPITSLPGQFHLSLDELLVEAHSLLNLGVRALILFPVIAPKYKDTLGSYALNSDSYFFEAIHLLKKEFPELTLIADIALDPFTTHGHDGLLSESGEVLNDETVEVLTQMAILQGQAGIDIVAPSDMMDGRIQSIREGLDEKGLQEVSILSYTAKYASAFYKPFRAALKSAPAFGNKKTYQMNPANSREALLEASLDEVEGADILMVKPASLYLDVIQKIRANTTLPIAAYHVSGEYAMLKAAAQNDWLDFDQTLYETLLGIKRSGADMIITYGAKELAFILKNSTEPQRKAPTGKPF